MFGRNKRRPTRLSIFLTAVIVTAWCGWVAFGEPLEDLFRGARNTVYQRPADGSVVIIKLDDKTFNRIGLDYSEAYDAKVVETLFRRGARRVYFDRTFKDIYDEAGAKKLLDVLQANPGRVYFGAIRSRDRFNDQEIAIEPNAAYLPYVRVASLNGRATPFGLAAELNYADRFSSGPVPSVSASIAGRQAAPGERYRPDWTIQAKTVPSASFIDVADGNLAPDFVQGKDVVIGPDSLRIPDHHHVIGQAWVPGVFFHAIGAQTLREGSPSRPSWFWPYVVALALSWFTLATRSRATANRVHATAFGLVATVPFLTDRLFMTVDYVPAIVLYAVVAYRSHSFKAIDSAERHNAGSGLPNLIAMRADADDRERGIAALVISNYESILAAFPEIAPRELLDAVMRPIRLSDAKVAIYHDDNTLYWILPALEPRALADHLEGLGKLVRTIQIDRSAIDLDVTLGVDQQYADPINRRANQARLAAAQAAAEGLTHKLYQAAAKDDAQWRLSLMSELDLAISHDQIDVVYQPQLDLPSGAITSAEALVRWNHPLRGPISPSDFIAHAESSNRIERLTFYVLGKALEDLVTVQASVPHFRVAVNLSTRLLASPTLAEQIIAGVDTAGVSRSSVKLEITETAAMTGNPVAQANLNALASAGIGLSIDDYGTGNATLEYLRKIPFSEIKIDQQFIAQLDKSHRDQMLVRSTIGLAHALGHTVTAEGVESEDTFKALKNLKCDRLQGYYISEPLRISALIDFVRDRCGNGKPLVKSRLRMVNK